MVKGKLKLISINKEDIKEGIKVVFPEENGIFTIEQYCKKDNLIYLKDIKNWNWLFLYQVGQIVIQYKETATDNQGRRLKSSITKQIPLQQSDWKKALEIGIDNEVEFEVGCYWNKSKWGKNDYRWGNEHNFVRKGVYCYHAQNGAGHMTEQELLDFNYVPKFAILCKAKPILYTEEEVKQLLSKLSRELNRTNLIRFSEGWWLKNKKK